MVESAYELWGTNHNGIESRMDVFGSRRELDSRVKELVLAHGWSEDDLAVVPLFAEGTISERAFAKGTFVTEQVVDTVARWKAEVLREALVQAMTWEVRLNEAEQMASQGIPIEPTKIKIAVNAERNAAIVILEDTR